MKTKRLLSLLLCVCMVLTLLPAVAITASAAGTGAMTLDTSGIEDGDAVYFGMYNSNAIQWRVLDADAGNATGTNDSLSDGSNAVNNGNAMFLLSEYILNSNVRFSSNPINTYHGSTVQTWVNTTLAANSSNFSTTEQGVMTAATKSDDAYTSTTYSVPFSAVTNILNGDKMFLLSAEEAITYLGSEGTNLVTKVGDDSGSAGWWWLRSPDAHDTNYAGVVNNDGSVADDFADYNHGARPAFNLNRDSVLFSSAAEGGKSSGAVGAGALTAVSTTTPTEWKLTLEDSGRNFDVAESTAASAAGGTVTLNYAGATVYNASTAPNEYISAMIMDANSNILYYGRLTQPASTGGTVDITIPSGLAEGSYTLKVFSEQYNGDKKTDYASAFSDVALTVDNTAPSVAISSTASGITNTSPIPVTITFSESVSGFELSDLVVTNGIAGNLSGSGTTYTADITPVSKSTVTVDITANIAQDMAGNWNTAAAQFTCTYDSTAPTVNTLTPNGSGNQINGSVIITFSEPMNTTAAGAVYLNGSSTALTGGNWSVSDTVYTMHYSGLSYSTAYTVTISGFKDAAGNTMTADSSHSFMTSAELDVAAPTVSGVTPTGTGNPISGDVIITFSETMNTTTAGAVYLNGSSTALTGGSWSVSDTVYTIGYSSLAYGTSYTVKISGFKDAAGNTMADDSTHSFTTKVKTSSGGGGSSATTYYTITATAGTGGSISPGGNVSVAYGNDKTYNITADGGYEIEDVLVDGVSVGAVSAYTFENVKKAHTITVSFKKTVVKTVNPFTDLTANDWFYENVLYVYKNGLMTGTGSDAFSPNGTMTRAMLVTVLYRLSGDKGSYTNSFSDVPSGAWYESAVAWAAKSGIASGVGGNRFTPENAVTREQFAVMLYNYAKYKGLDVSVDKDTKALPYNDAANISDYAYSALQWACGAGIMNGDGNGSLNPQSSATRAEVAAMLQRFIENVIG